MSLAELFNTTQEGLSNFSGNASTCIRSYRIKSKPVAQASADSMAGGIQPATARLFPDRGVQVTSGTQPNLLKASTNGNVMGADIETKVSFILNDNRNVSFVPPLRDDGHINLYEATVKASGSLGAAEWGKSLTLFGSSAKDSGVTPGAGSTGSEPAMQFKFTMPEFTQGLKSQFALSKLSNDVLNETRGITAFDDDIDTITHTHNLNLEGKVSYDVGYGTVFNLEFLNGKAHSITSTETVGIARITPGLSDDIRGLAGSIDLDMYGFTGSIGTSKTEGLGHMHPALGGFETTAGARKYKHTYAKGAYTVEPAVASVPVKVDLFWGKTEQDGSEGEHTATNLFKENTRKGICIGTPLSDDLTFDLCYDRYDTKNSAGVKNNMEVTSICGRYKF